MRQERRSSDGTSVDQHWYLIHCKLLNTSFPQRCVQVPRQATLEVTEPQCTLVHHDPDELQLISCIFHLAVAGLVIEVDVWYHVGR